MRIGLFGGTFNPIHSGHLKALEIFAEYVDGLTVVMPAGNPPHKSFQRSISDKDRLNLVKKAIGERNNIVVSDYEITKREKSYTVDTLKMLRAEYGNESEIFLYVGSDSFLNLTDWYLPAEILKMATPVCLVRRNEDKTAVKKKKKELKKLFGTESVILPFNPIEISSSELRDMLSFNNPESVLYFPETVFDVIQKKKLYFSGNEEDPELCRLARSVRERTDFYRYRHCVGVMKTARELAIINGANQRKAEIAGILHDITKHFTEKQQLQLVQKYDINVDEMQLRYPKILHGLTASYVVKYELGIDDREILSAIKYHSTAKPRMTPLEMIVWAADFVDPTRDYEDIDYYRDLVYNDLKTANFKLLAYTLQDLASRGKYIHKDTFNAYNYYAIINEENKK